MLCECRGFSAVFARIYAVDSNAASASPSIPGAANAVRVPGSAFQAGAAPGLADPARAGGTCLWPSTTERNLLVVLHVHERVSERFSGFLGDDDGGDSLGQGADRSRRVDPQRTGNDGSVNDVQIAVPENFSARPPVDSVSRVCILTMASMSARDRVMSQSRCSLPPAENMEGWVRVRVPSPASTPWANQREPECRSRVGREVHPKSAQQQVPFAF